MSGEAGVLLARLRADADAAIEARANAARAEAEALRREAREEAARRRDAMLAQHVRDAERDDALASDEARGRAWRALLVARADALDRIFAATASALNAQPSSPALRKRLAEQLTLALGYVPTGDAVVRAPAPAIDAVRAAVAGSGRAGLSVVPDDSVPLGLVVETPDRTFVVDATFARALERDRARLAIALVREVEGEVPA